MMMMLITAPNLLEVKRVAQFIFDQQEVTTYHNGAATSKISGGEKRCELVNIFRKTQSMLIIEALR